ncbi:MAG TPA: sigma-70 family RNA polymerase sigma factor [Verrucomicrobiae bacterium]|nr:sigma-70 family RNA polymerase sigma factor [Verrucomicrobiae bacterium]
MNHQTDGQLLRIYAEHNSESAFAELVQRQLDFVYSAALRMVCDPHLAEDVTQSVFVALANNAAGLTERTNLCGWLHQTAQNIAAQTVRTIERRRAREQKAATMNPLLSSESDISWEQIAPHLDAAIGDLGKPDRDVLFLRYFKNYDLRTLGTAFGISDDAAQKRVSRAVERLRERLAKRGVAAGAGGLVIFISANAVQAAPAGLATTVTAAAIAGTAISTSTIIAATKAIAMTTIQKTLITTAFVATVGAGIFEAHQISQLREQNQTLQQQQQPMAEQLTNLQSENERLSNLVAEAKDQKSLSQAQFNELLKLRGKIGQAQTAVQETAKLRTALQESTASSKFTSDALAQGTAMIEQIKKKNELAKLARMKDKLNLTDSQQQAISDLITKNSEARARQSLIDMSGKRTPEQLKAAMIASLQTFGNEEAEVKALLTPEQLAAYPDYQQSETMVAANNRANLEATMMTSDLNLSPEQQDKVNKALYQFGLDHTANQLASSLVAQKPGNVADAMNSLVEVQQQELADKLKVLGRILTPDQLQSYRQSQLEKIDSMASAAKVFLPQMTNGAAQ